MARAAEHVNATSGDRRALYDGFGNALTLAFELALIPIIFALGGLWLDGRFHTKPTFTVILALLAIFGLGARSYYAYKARMAAEEEGKPWARTR